MIKRTTEQFINEAKIIHNNQYSYSNTIFISTKIKVKIICPIHGQFEQRADHHLNGFKCKLCSCKETSKKVMITKENFFKKANAVHNHMYDYSLFSPCKAKDKISIKCKEHGIFKQSYDSHINHKAKCPKCSQKNGNILKRDTTDEFILKSKNIHADTYNYDKVKYVTSKTKVIITCKSHGDFNQMPENHLQGKGCKECMKETNVFSKQGFINISKDKECIFYIIKCFNETEEFYKIGITSRSIQQRYVNKLSMPYNFEIIQEIKGNADTVWNLELKHKQQLKQNQYTPAIKFAGSKTECFKIYSLEIYESP